MKEEIKAAIDALTDRDESSLEENLRNRTEADAFVARFHDLQVGVIRPVMEDIGRHLKARGYDSQILVKKEPVNAIFMELLSEMGQQARMPILRVEFVAREPERDVLMEGTSHLLGTLDMEVIELDRVHEDLVGQFIHRILEKTFA
jgi:hypothetical protein